MEHQSEEEGRKWSDGLDAPLPGQRVTDELDPSESDQLKYL